MLHLPKVIEALETKRDTFRNYQTEQREGRDLYEKALDLLSRLSREEIATRSAEVPLPGARPTAEHDTHDGVIVPFEHRWSNHEEARVWARRTVRGTPAFAVDGSQITPSQDISIPVGAVQIGWFDNPHLPGGKYVKDVRFEVIAPDELSEDRSEATEFPDWRVNLRRFELECEVLADYIRRSANRAPKPLCFYDGSLVISFAAQMRPERQGRYVDSIIRLLDASTETGVPLVGYVDFSRARDLLRLLGILMKSGGGPRLSDAVLLNPHMSWGDRCQAYLCARDDALERKYYDRIIFLYLKASAEAPPARIDLPRWVLERGELNRVLDLVRAECVVGNGYPYALETADAVAVITMQDRERFHRAFQEFASSAGLPLGYARKALSKRRRR